MAGDNKHLYIGNFARVTCVRRKQTRAKLAIRPVV